MSKTSPLCFNAAACCERQVRWEEPSVHLEEFRSGIRRRAAERVQLAAQRELVTEAEVCDFNVHVGIQQEVLSLRRREAFISLPNQSQHKTFI